MNSFSKLLEQARTDKERQKLLDVRKSSGMDDDDPLWTFVWLAELMCSEWLMRPTSVVKQPTSGPGERRPCEGVGHQNHHIPSRMAVFNETLKRNALMVLTLVERSG